MGWSAYRKALLTSTVLSVAGLVFCGGAFAQSGGPASGTTLDPPAQGIPNGPAAATAPTAASVTEATPAGQLQDIVVTARRTNERLQTTPVAVTALTGQLLLQRQVSNVLELARAAPSLSIGTGGTGPASIVYLAIRGQAQNSPNSFSDPAVGIYIDGVYVARAIVGNLGFLDPGSAEVLRGPQGTLFGRNTTGGALNLTTAQPTDRIEGYVKGGYGNYDAYVLEGVVNIPLTNTLAARFAGRYDQHRGYNPNPFLGYRQGNVSGEYYGRGTVKWSPTNLPITWTVSGDYTHYKDHGNAVAISAINPAGPLSAFYGLSQAGVPGFTDFAFAKTGSLQQYVNPEFATAANPASGLASQNWLTTFGAPKTGDPEIDNLKNFNEAGSATSNLIVDLGGVTLKSITGYRTSTTSDSLDLTGTPTSGGAFVSEYKQNQWSEELQLSGKTGRLQYIGGLYYFREQGSERSDSAIFYNTPFGTFARNLGDYHSESKGIFVQGNYNFTDALRVTAGIRYTWDTRFIDRHALVDFRAADPVCNVGPNIGKPASAARCTDPNEANFQYPAWTLGIDYKLTPDVFIYAKTSGASNSGGFNSRPVPPPYSQSFQPEDVKDVELGFKGEFLDKHVRTNVAGFYAWQSNVQRIINTTFVDSSGKTQLTQFVSNAGDVGVYGLELEGTVLPWRGMDVSGSFAYLHAAYDSGSRNETQLVGGLPVIVDRSREPITQAPKYTYNISGTQTFDLNQGKLTLHLDYAYVSSRYFDFFTTGNPAQAAAVAIANEASRIRGYGLLNGQVSFALKNPGVEIAVWGKNLTNQPWFTNVFNSYTGLGATEQFQGAPRTYGVTAAYRF